MWSSLQIGGGGGSSYLRRDLEPVSPRAVLSPRVASTVIAPATKKRSRGDDEDDDRGDGDAAADGVPMEAHVARPAIVMGHASEDVQRRDRRCADDHLHAALMVDGVVLTRQVTLFAMFQPHVAIPVALWF